MLTNEELEDVIGRTVFSRDGEKLGKVGTVYVDDASEEPQFLSVHTGLFGTRETLVPATEAMVGDDGVTVPFALEAVKDAPTVSTEQGRLDPEEERRLFDFYGLQYSVNPAYGTPPEPPRHGAGLRRHSDRPG